MSAVRKIATPQPLASRFDALGIAAESFAHAPVFRVGEGEDIKAALAGGHTKNLFLKDKKGQIWLISALSDTEINLKTLHRRIDSARLSFGNAELLQEVLGVVPGSVTPFGLIHDTDRRVRVVLDEKLFSYDILNFHPLENDKTTAITAPDLLKFIKSSGYTPLIVDFQRS